MTKQELLEALPALGPRFSADELMTALDEAGYTLDLVPKFAAPVDPEPEPEPEPEPTPDP